MSGIQITGIVKDGGPLTKRISLGQDGTLKSDGSHCVMSSGVAKRVFCASLREFANGISTCESRAAIALGALRPDLPDDVQVVTKARLNGSTANNVIARSGEFIAYREGQPTLALLDVDTKGMPTTVRDRVEEAGGFWGALVSVVPELEQTARVIRRSTTTGIYRSDTGEKLPGSNGMHIFPLVQDGADIERFLRTMHDRCWLAGFGWYMVGAGGQLLERSIVDRMVYAAERLVFEGAPILDPPLLQDLASRQAEFTDGAPLNTNEACLALTVVEKARLEELRAKDAHRLASDRAKARAKFVTEQAERIVIRIGCSPNAARRAVEQQCAGIPLSDVVLPFDDKDMEGCTVKDVLADPDRFVGATLADPLEGVGYGRCKAKVMRRAAGDVRIHSFAHGRTVYELKHSTAAIEAILAATPDDQLAAAFVQMAAAGDLTGEDQQRLRDDVSQRTKINKRTLDQSMRELQKQQETLRRQEQRIQQAAERRDPRPRIIAPTCDAPWLPQMAVLNEVLGKCTQPRPPTRDFDEERARLKMRAARLMHLLSSNQDQETIVQ